MLSSFETASSSSSKTPRLQGTVLYCGRAIPIFFWLGNICVSFKDKILINSITIMFRQFNPQKMLLKCDGRVCWESIPPCSPQQLVKVNTGNRQGSFVGWVLTSRKCRALRMPRRTDRVFFGANRPYSLNQACHGNIYKTKRDDLNFIVNRLACSSVVQWLFQRKGWLSANIFFV